MKTLFTLAFLLFTQPVWAQTEFRPFFLFDVEHFSASTTFDVTIGSAVAPHWGGGVDVLVRKRFFVDLAVSHMSRGGERAIINGDQVFRVGIPLRASFTPIEVTAGYRFHLRRWRMVPYAGAGIGSYSFRETADFAAVGDDVDVRHAGFVAVGGAEFRVTRWVAVAGDAEFTRVPGILGQGGLSKDVGEDNFGGVAARLRVIIGR